VVLSAAIVVMLGGIGLLGMLHAEGADSATPRVGTWFLFWDCWPL
jgi:hypothetical protein